MSSEAASAALHLGQAIGARLDELATLTDEPGRLTRLYLSPAHARAIAVVGDWMRQAGLTVHLDAAATLIGRDEGAQLQSPTLILGSHIDTVRDAGRYDGNLGVLVAIEAVAELRRRNRRLCQIIDSKARRQHRAVAAEMQILQCPGIATDVVPEPVQGFGWSGHDPPRVRPSRASSRRACRIRSGNPGKGRGRPSPRR